mmetsp:Transcript_73030/g.128679  ORF Transcript_73030/g.128679 Transcript_73030/m.128679 type:complete len:276 (+) Transcript_73030:164-991(+)
MAVHLRDPWCLKGIGGREGGVAPRLPSEAGGALLPYDFGPDLVVLLLGNPCGLVVLHQLGQHCTPQKDHVLAPRGVLNAQLEFRQSGPIPLQGRVQILLPDLVLDTGWQARKHGRAPAEDDVLVHLHAVVDGAVLNGAVDEFGHPVPILVHQTGLEQHLGCLKALGPDPHHPPVRQLIGLLQDASLVCQPLLKGGVACDVAEPFLDLTHCVEVRSPVESIPSTVQELDKILRNVGPRQVHPLHCILYDEPVHHRDGVGAAVPTVTHQTPHEPLCV